ncbi:MAG TPA: hypothetical protein VFW40_07160, partial [Capsulimonadaceae bacterium]|nr:hypothetical protein [Capsulimonadaceae bacterium]
LLAYSLFGNIVSTTFLASLYLYTRSLWTPISCSITSWLLLSGTTFLIQYTPNFAVMHFAEIVAAAWLIVMTIRKGEWKPGPNLNEIARATRANVIKIVEATDPGKQVDDSPPIAPAGRQ